ncbi:MAG: hypothetical protein ABI599_01850 [Flavobacteriales bacterium]
MDNGKQFTRIGELASGIAADVRRLEEGKLPITELEELADSARELHERLIVLRHKAREGKPVPVPVPSPAPVAPPAPAPVPAPAPAQEPQTIRLDTAPKQTSLIDAIAETEVPGAKAKAPKPPVATAKSETQKMPPHSAVPTLPGAAKPVASVGAKLERAPIADLGKAVALSQKFWFVAELFGGDRGAYEHAVDQLNKAPGRAEAKVYLQEEVLQKLKTPPGEDVLAAFNELIERRHR